MRRIPAFLLYLFQIYFILLRKQVSTDIDIYRCRFPYCSDDNAERFPLSAAARKIQAGAGNSRFLLKGKNEMDRMKIVYDFAFHNGAAKKFDVELDRKICSDNRAKTGPS